MGARIFAYCLQDCTPHEVGMVRYISDTQHISAEGMNKCISVHFQPQVLCPNQQDEMVTLMKDSFSSHWCHPLQISSLSTSLYNISNMCLLWAHVAKEWETKRERRAWGSNILFKGTSAIANYLLLGQYLLKIPLCPNHTMMWTKPSTHGPLGDMQDQNYSAITMAQAVVPWSSEFKTSTAKKKLVNKPCDINA
jgi:hypothetical protein